MNEKLDICQFLFWKILNYSYILVRVTDLFYEIAYLSHRYESHFKGI